MPKKLINKNGKYYGFTLIELIIVITILAILATISFISFSGYSSKSRDSNRLFSLKEISKALEIQKESTGNYPQPDEIYTKGGIPNLDSELFNVGLIGKNVSNYVKLGLIPLDPKTGNEYLYGLTRDNKNFQIAGTLENLQSSMIIPVTYADNGMQAVVEGNYKGVITFSTGSVNYVGNLPSLILSKSGTYSSGKTFVINKGKNLPYSVDGETLGTGLSETEVLKELHNKDSLTLTGVIITNPKSEDEIKEIANILGISHLIISENLGNTKNLNNLETVLSSKIYLSPNGITIKCDLEKPGETVKFKGKDYWIATDSIEDIQNKIFTDNFPAENICTSHVTLLGTGNSTGGLFYNKSDFNGNISSWDTSNVVNFSGMFRGATIFNQNIGNWDLSNATNIFGMFYSAKEFNQDIGNWNTSSVVNMQSLFNGAAKFNQNIGNWDTSKVTNMYGLFNGAIEFNQDISLWNVGNVKNMDNLFKSANSFNQDLSNWCVSKILSIPPGFDLNANSWNKVNRTPIWGTCPSS